MWDKARITSEQDSSILPARVANYSARFGSSYPLTELVNKSLYCPSELRLEIEFCLQLCDNFDEYYVDGKDSNKWLSQKSHKERII